MTSSTKRKVGTISLCLLGLFSVRLIWLNAKQPQNKINTLFEPARAIDNTARAVTAAKAFLATLDDAARSKASLPFDSSVKSRWSNFPVAMVPRNGVRVGDMTAPQRAAASELLAVTLSPRGLQKVKEIMEGDEVLKTTDTGPPGGPRAGGQPPGLPPGAGQGGPGRGANPMFGRDNYFLAFFGAPSLSDPWMIQFGGHHLAINVTIVGKSNVLAPSLPAAQPAAYKLNSETVRPLGRENDKGFALINSLDGTQQQKAILNYQVNDLVLGAGQDGKVVQPEGIKVSTLNAAQQERLLDLIREWVGILNDEAANAKMADVKANLAESWFAWSGSTTNGSAAYFRIQGPTIWIEYSPQRTRGGGLDINH